MISCKGVNSMNLNQKELNLCRGADLMGCDPEALVDLKDVQIDTTRPVAQRMEDFVRQVGNPYLFRVDGLIVKAVYLPGAKRRLTDALPYC